MKTLAPRFDPPGSVLARLADKHRPVLFVRTDRWAMLRAEVRHSSPLDAAIDVRTIATGSGKPGSV